jgi:3-methyladenine DNA glycosylase AlkD
MSEHSTNWYAEMQVASGEPALIGRGSGWTLRDFNRRLNEMMSRRGMESRQWKTLEQRRAAEDLNRTAERAGRHRRRGVPEGG